MSETGSTCGSSTSLTFSAAPSQGALVAEDFTARGSTVAGGADWNTQQQELIASFPLPVGDGSDGDLGVSAGQLLDAARAEPRFSLATKETVQKRAVY